MKLRMRGNTLRLRLRRAEVGQIASGHHRPGEDDADTFPHPDAESGRNCQ